MRAGFTPVLLFLITGLIASRGCADETVMLRLDPLARERARLATGLVATCGGSNCEGSAWARQLRSATQTPLGSC